MVRWVLKKGEDRRLRSGHPWVFSNELLTSPKGILPGEKVELVDQRGHFLARGYGNPHSLIAFRAVSWSEGEQSILNPDFFVNRLLRAWRVRTISGLKQSFRLCYGEADGLPGLVIDRYVVREGVVFAVQLLTAGMQRAIFNELESVLRSLLIKAQLEGLFQGDPSRFAIVLRNDVNIRKLEGLQAESPREIVSYLEGDLGTIDIAIDTLDRDKPIWMNADLLEGQKTGFFLDQRGNIHQVLRYLKDSELPSILNRKVKILDLCCYVGHWSSQLAALLSEMGVELEIHLVDISEKALKAAQANVSKACGKQDQIHVHQMDATASLDTFKDNSFDIVIADPPAFIKAKKDLPTGSHAYLKMNAHAFRVAAFKGLVLSCSCSGLMEIDHFRDILRKSQHRQGLSMPAVLFGGHSPDHPVTMSFPEGIYLKMIGHLKI